MRKRDVKWERGLGRRDTTTTTHKHTHKLESEGEIK